MDASLLSYVELPADAGRLRVAVVTETYPPEINGVSLTTARVVDGLVKHGNSVMLVRPRQNAGDVAAQEAHYEEMLSRGLPIPRYPHLKMGLPARSALIRLWSVKRPDVVLVVTEGPLGWSALAAARKLRLPTITEFHTNFHSYSTYYGVGWLKTPVKAYLRRFHNKGDVCLVPTRALAASLQRDGVRQIEVVPRGVDTDLFTPARRDEALRASWGAEPHTLVVAVIGRLAPEKNLALAIRAFEAIQQRVPEARLLFVGDGPSRESLARRYPEHSYAGMRTGDDLAAHYASADMFLFPSLTETFGNVTTEALASGLPVVCFDYAAGAERVREGHNGALAPVADENAFVDAALRVAGDRCGRLAMAKAARQSVQNLGWPAVAAQMVQLMTGIIKQHEVRNGVWVAG
ncbi:glycosyltransferase family 4 protein [Denitromonas ohlonensis]|uniref:Glycosyltransferase family 1 protein n=2 Tax=Denitromonas TaxID=139331 RepID=A0A558E533_9RHOO|nr:glycosyltransferase family 1 protein [Denitromonas ohlonensis]TVT47081.1 MAG: glycosyltransferase family 1 protein [Denitromonas halophila]TVO60251.1 glycosyltransferase family 1 protein [Denitromonas ohlonensis]TVO75770.1 glycosyltransferase family 1 protein [Denitromonas ohlonensis]TVT68189.1 MAG: glycosyltransferase family 1 protein [Denitromonas halophila]TVT68210.1 MAG: glycosyltransferase family 1 protein [Denitromonas halophila]